MATVADTFAVAFENHQAGKLPVAERLYQQILQADPHHAGAHHLLGALAYQTGRFDHAVLSIRQAISLNPGAAEYHCNLGLAYAALGQMEEAAISFRQALALRSDFPEAHLNLGNALLHLGRSGDAAAHYQQAIRQRPGNAEVHCNLGVLLANQGQVDEAIANWRQAIAIRPDYPEAHNNLGNALHHQGKDDEAVLHCKVAIRLRPDFAEAYNNLANALMSQGKLEETASRCRQALQLRPDFPEAHYNLAIALRDLGKLEDAVDSYQRTIRHRPDFPEAHTNLGDVYLKLGLPELALASIQEALRLQPNLGPALRNVLFQSNYDPKGDPDAVFAEHCRWGELQEAACQVERDAHSDFHAWSDDPNRRLRIGYVSPDFRMHALARYMEPVLANHDPNKVEVFCYAEVQISDAVTNRLRSLAHHWFSTCHLTDTQVAQRIRSDRIDILIDLAGHTCNSLLSVFALKPAPVQATWLGYLNTTGLKSVDYRLTDEFLDPLNQPIRDTEELVRLPAGMCCFAPPADAPGLTPLPAERQGYLTFGSTHTLFKLNAAVFDLWTKVLKAVPSARLLMFRDALTKSVRDRIRRQFAERGIGAGAWIYGKAPTRRGT